MDEEYLWLSAINQGLYLGYVLYIFLGTARHVSLPAGRFETRGKSVTRYFALIISVLGPWWISCQLALLQYSYFPMDEEYLWQSAINQGLFLSFILYIFLVLQDTCFSAGWKILNKREEFYQCLVNIKEDRTFFSGGQDLCVWSEKGELLDKMQRNSEDCDIHTLLPIKNNRIVAASNKFSLVVYSVTRSTDDSQNMKIVEVKKLPPHRESIRCLISVADSMFASASLDGAIILWSSLSLSSTRQFNFVKDYEGPFHTYPASTQHIFTVDQKYILASIGHGFFLYDTMSGNCLAKVTNAHHGKIIHSVLLCKGYLLATCSEDGSVRIWGSPNPLFVCDGSTSPSFTLQVERFLGKSISEVQNIKSPITPALLGECLAHTGAIHMAVNLAEEGFASCGSDGLVVLWKDGELEKKRRNEMVRNILLSMDDTR